MSVNVLVVDDSKVERMYLAGLLERLGVQSDTAESSEEAVLRACEEPFDMFFIDYFMPDADGVHALKEIRSNESTLNAETPAVALGTADPVLGEDFFIMQGFVNYLEKPVGFEMLHAALLLYLPEEKRAEIRNGELTVDGGEQDSVIPRWLSDIPEMNVADGVKNCGSEEGFMSALEIFFKSVGKMSDEIQGYYDSGNWTDYTIKVHALKSSARIIGLAELSELARQLEAAGDAKDLGFIHDNTGNLLTMYREYEQKLSPLSGDEAADDDSGKPLAEPDFIEDAFMSLEEFAGQMDYDSVEMVLDSLAEYRLPPEDKELYDEINDAFMNLDWNGMKTAAHKYAVRVYGE